MIVQARVSERLIVQSAYLRRCEVVRREEWSCHAIVVVDHRRLAREKRRIRDRRVLAARGWSGPQAGADPLADPDFNDAIDFIGGS